MQQRESLVVPTMLHIHRLQSQSDSLAILSTMIQANWNQLDVQLQGPSGGERLHEALLAALQKLKLLPVEAKAAEIKDLMASVQVPLLAKLLEYNPPADAEPPFFVWRIPLARWREEQRDQETSPVFTLGGLKWRLVLRANGAPDHQPPDCLACYLELQNPPPSGASCHIRIAALHPSDPSLSSLQSDTHTFNPKASSWGWHAHLQPTQLAEFTHDDGCVAVKATAAPVDAHGNVQWIQQRSADELLLHFACELSSADLTLLWPFVTQLIDTLHARGFDLNQRDSQGRTLLTQYAAQSNTAEGVLLVQLLLRLGACASVESASGSSLPREWVRLNRRDLLLAALQGSAPWQMLFPQVEVWQRGVSGTDSLLLMVEGKGAGWSDVTTCMRGLEHHWRTHKRPLLLRCVSEFTPLVLDLAQLVLSYLDGQARPSDGQ